MDCKAAIKILEIDSSIDKYALKKKYRQLMRLVHPDNGEEAGQNYPYTAQEINEAYTFLSNNSLNNANKEQKKKTTGNSKWTASINPHAFAKRKIYDEVTDSVGNVIGYIEVAQGKYLWETDEEFRLFLKSIYELSKKMLNDIDEKQCRSALVDFEKYQAELTYLLSSQYIDSKNVLYNLNYDVENTDDEEVFYIPAMINAKSSNVRKSQIIYPAGLKNHRLYVCDAHRRDLGYLSFADDRLPFIVIPLLEQKGVQIKMNVSANKITSNKYDNVDCWIKVPSKQNSTYIDSVNLKIGNILNEYEKSI